VTLRDDIVVPEVGADAAVADAVRHAVSRSATRLLDHERGVRSGDHPEDVHQARVATRRLRSDLRTFGDVLEPSWTTPLRDELRWLGDLLGDVRDADVLRERLLSRLSRLADEDRSAAELLIANLDARRDDARVQLLTALNEARYRRVADAVVAAARAPAVLPEVASARADAAFRPALESLWKDMDEAIGHAVADASDESLHRARIRTKRLRYAADAVEPVFGKRARRFAKAAAAFQDVLGAHQDAVVAAAWLREAAEATPTTAFVAGELAALETEAAHEARDGWPRAWKRLSRKKLRFWT
jgi:CHAD domain-containing protein